MTFTAYSRDPRLSTFTTFPATLMLKKSPIDWSKTASAGIRESMQLKTAAKGYWPAADALTFAGRFFWTVVPARKRALPCFRVSTALAGVMAACDSLVWMTEAFGGAFAPAFGSSGSARTVKAAKKAMEIQAREIARIRPSSWKFLP